MANQIFTNKRAYRDYTVAETMEAGLVLEGWEVKSLKANMADFRGSFIIIDTQGSPLIRDVNVASWKTGELKSENQKLRDRRLLLHKREIAKLQGYTRRPGYTVIPLEVYTNAKGLIKVKIGIVKGKKKYEKKRDAIDKAQRKREKVELGKVNW